VILETSGRPARVLLLGGTSEIGLAIARQLRLPAGSELLLAGRDQQRMTAAAAGLPWKCSTLPFDATAADSHAGLIDAVFSAGPVDVVIAAAGILLPQPELDRDPAQAARLITTNFTGHVTALLAAAGRMRAQRHGLIIVLSSIAAVRPRRANFVYGAAKAGLDAFARGLADALHGSGVRVLLVRPGFVTGRMTTGLPPAPMSRTPAEVGAAVARAAGGRAQTAWIPRGLAAVAVALRLVPRPLWRRLRR
jgi:decaprenylphospho-beta-D-erythro-pentofuranosid-2-ulose 2-reductase